MLRLEYHNFLSKFGTWTIIGSEMLKVRKIAKFVLQLWVDISWTTTAKASKFCVMLRLEYRNFLSKFGTWTIIGSEMLKVRKIAKSVLQLWVDISWTTTAKASIFCVMLKLERGNFLSKFGTWTSIGSEMLKVRRITKSVLHLWVDISWTTTVKASKFCVMLRLERGKFLSKFGIWIILGSEMLKGRKIAKSGFQVK